MKSKFNLPNFITSIRIILIPLIIYFIFNESVLNLLIAIIIFTISALTDTIDGLIARRYKQTSDFGASFDPLADKILIWSVFTVFIFKKELLIPFYLVVFIYIRDLIVTFIRYYSKKMNYKFSTSFIAKAKTTFQMISIIIILLYMLITNIIRSFYKLNISNYFEIWKTIFQKNYFYIVYIPFILTLITVIFTLYSAFDYIKIFYKERKKNDK